MPRSVVETISVAHADVLHIAGQITRDLQRLHKPYPDLLNAERVLELNDAVATFLANDAVTRIGFSIVDPAQQNLVLHELRYEISHAGSEHPPTSRGGATASRVKVPGTTASGWCG